MSNLLPVEVCRLEATIPEGIPIRWQGKEFASGPLRAELSGSSGGVLDYDARRARLEFQVELRFPEFAEILRDLGVNAESAAPVRATIRSSGAILDDHSFALNGRCDVAPHPLFADPARPPAEHAAAQMLPGT